MLRTKEQCKIIEDYKGFRSRQSPDSDNYYNAFYVREDGTEVCLGQTNNIRRMAEYHLRYPLPKWMTGKDQEEWSPFSDQERIKSTCAHDVPLSQTCDKCVESYGSARVC